jgi:DNA replication protein DnaC
LKTLVAWPFLIIDDLGMRKKLPLTAAEDLLELIMRRYERASTLVTSNRPVEDWGKLLGDAAAVTAMLASSSAGCNFRKGKNLSFCRICDYESHALINLDHI